MPKQGIIVGTLAFALFALSRPNPALAQTMDAGKAMTKLGRGCLNIVTGWVEIPKRVQETSQKSGPAAGFTLGLLRGIGYGFVRTAAGFYELFTFPFPAPPEYEPVIEPEFVFSAQSM